MAKKSRTAARVAGAKKADKAKKAKKTEAGGGQPTAAEFDAAEQALLVNTHIPAFVKSKARIAAATNGHRTVLKEAKADGFTRHDLEYAVALQDAEKEAREKAKMRRRIVIAKMVGSDLGQLDLFDQTNTGVPVEDRAYQEGKMASANNQAAKPDYAPDTKAHAEYMRGFHEHQEGMLKDGIKKKEAAKPDKPAPRGGGKTKANGKHSPAPADAKPHVADVPTSGVPTSRSEFLAQQAARAQQQASQPQPTAAAPAAPAAAPADDDDDGPSAFQRRA